MNDRKRGPGFLDELRGLVVDTVRGALSPEKASELDSRLKAEVDAELNRPPKIAVIGKCGVGKSSTLNALFGTSLPVSHVEACTQVEEAVSFDGTERFGKAGKLIIYDMPGLGEDLDADIKHRETYARVLQECDVALWVMVASGAARAMAYDQLLLRDVVAAAGGERVLRHLVVGLSQVETIQPGAWIRAANVPSREQKESIERRVSDVKAKLVKVCPGLTAERIVPYSSHKRYRLEHLFETLVSACGDERAWVLESRRSVADFRELVDPELLRRARGEANHD